MALSLHYLYGAGPRVEETTAWCGHPLSLSGKCPQNPPGSNILGGFCVFTTEWNRAAICYFMRIFAAVYP